MRPFETYPTALEDWPGHIGTVQALAWLHVVARREAPELGEWLDEIALRGESERWREWAKGRAARLP
jgi:hypothetical protein